MRLILVKSGESLLDRQKKIAGWCDSGLTISGVEEVRKYAEILNSSGVNYDIVFTSYLRSDLESAFYIQEKYCPWIPQIKAWQLNDRHFGIFEGLARSEAERKYGKARFKELEENTASAPPVLPEYDFRNPVFDMRYFGVSKKCLPLSESLENLSDRILAYYKSIISSYIRNGSNVLLVLHKKPIATIISYMESISARKKSDVETLFNEPVVIYELNKNADVKGCMTLSVSDIVYT